MGDLLERYLCSPRKIRRLDFGSQNLRTSTPEEGKIGSQNSQQSRATSTPTKESRGENLTISTDLSSINVAPVAQVEKLLISEVQDDEDDVVSSARSILEELSLRETPSSFISGSARLADDLLEAPSRKFFKGKLWKFFQPKTEGSLYFKILTDLDSIEEYAFDLLNEFQTHKNKATLRLIKFFIDVCGYQTAEIESYFDFNQDFNISSERVIKLLEFDLVDQELLDNKTYIFLESEKEKSKLGATLAMAVRSFMEKFFIGAYTMNLLFSDALYKHVFNFLYHMCHSILRPIRHTGVVLVRILLTVLNSIFDRILKNVELEKDSESDHDGLPAKKEREYMERYISYFFRIFGKNSFIPDPQLAVLRAENVKEMGTWAIDLPKIYFEKCFELLLKLLLDESEAVRLSTLKVFESFLKNMSSHLYVTRNINNFIKMVSDRFKDVSVKVVVGALDIFTVLLDNYRQFIGKDDVCQISELLYGNNYFYAKAAGSFLSKFFTSAYTDEAQLLRKLVKLSTIPRFSKMKPLLVEGFSEYETVLQNYEFLVNYFLTCSKDENSEYANNVMELIYFSVYQTLKGESAMMRKNSLRACPLPSHHENIAKIFLLNLQSLFELYQSNTVALNYLLKIICLIDFEVLTSSYHGHVLYIMKNCRQFFLKGDEDEFLENICNIFNLFCFDKNTSLRENMKNHFLDNFFDSMSVYLRGYFEPEDPEIPLEIHFMKISKLYEKFNMNKHFKWNDLFVNWGNVLLCEGQIVACTQFLIWSTEELTTELDRDSDALRLRCLNFNKIFPEYTKSLVALIMSFDTTDGLRYKAFCSLCHLYTSSDRILLQEGGFDGIRFNIMENLRKDLSQQLSQFFKKRIVYNRSQSQEARKKYITNWLNLILNGIVDVLYIVPLFECYYIRSQEYGSLIDIVSDKLFNNNPRAFFDVLLVTLGGLADEIFGDAKKSVTSPEAIELMELAAKFANMKQFRQFSEEVLRLIHLGISFAFNENLLEFFILLQNFIPKLFDDRKKCLDTLMEITPPEYEEHQIVKAFRMKLKSEKTKAERKNATFGKDTSTSSSSTSKQVCEENIEPVLKKRRRSSKSKNLSKQLGRETQSEKVSNRKKLPRTSENNVDKRNVPVKPKSQKKKE